MIPISPREKWETGIYQSGGLYPQERRISEMLNIKNILSTKDGDST